MCRAWTGFPVFSHDGAITVLDVKFKLFQSHISDRVWMAPSKMNVIYWNTTYACNFQCSVCFENAGKRRPDELSTHEAIEMLNQAHRAGVRDVVISGGEPFMRKDLIDILTHMSSLGITARIASNGSLLDEKILRRLKNETLVESFQISIDTLDPDLYEHIHGAPNHLMKKVLDNLQKIREFGFHTTVSTRLMPQTVSGIPEIIDRALMEGWSTVTVHLPLAVGRNKYAYAQDTNFLTLLEPAFEHFLQCSEKALVEMFIPWAQYHPASLRLQEKIKVVYAGCRAGRDRLAVNPCGDVSVCVCFDTPSLYVGNVRQNDLADTFENASLCHLMRHPEKYGICKGCPNLPVCGGGCRVAAYAITNRIDGDDRSCPRHTCVSYRGK